jgi:hypothetical protein
MVRITITPPKTFPYLNGGFYGEVIELNGQVDPQPRAQGVAQHFLA